MKKKRIFILTLISAVLAAFFAVCFFCSAQGDAPETLIEAGVTKWRYKTMTFEDFWNYNYNWTDRSGASVSWKTKESPFGDRIDYDRGSGASGWRDDQHVLLLVTTFRITDLDLAKQKDFIARIFYDNTMTIYLNNQEIFYDYGWVDSYVELNLNFSDALVRGYNTLAISLLDDMGGREFDMTLTMQSPGSSISPELTVTEDQLAETGLSTFYIDTDDGGYVESRLEYSDATLRIDLSDTYKSYTNTFTSGTGGSISIRGRGNSTWNNGYPDGKQNTLPGDTHTRKVPYNLKLSEKADLFGMGKSKKWVLVANYMDRSMLRNKLIYDLSGRMGMTFCKSVYVNLVLNGEYMGVYALTQKIEPDLFGDQVTDWEDLAEDFAKAVAKKYGYNSNWQSDFEDRLCADMSWLTAKTFEGYTVSEFVDLSEYSLYTGYLIEYDGYADEDSFFTTDYGVPLKVSNMEAIKTNPTLFAYVRDFFNDFEDACYGSNFCNDKGKHYSEYVDMDSLVDCFILNTVILNVEFGYKSMYMYINDEGKIVFGPCWDLDWSSGNPFLGANGDYNAWYNDARAENNKWFRELYGDPWFVSLVRERWAQLDSALDGMVDSIDYYYDLLYKASELEYAKFSTDPYEWDFALRTGGRSFWDECNQLKTFLQRRIEWLDGQFSQREPNIENRGMQTDSSLLLNLSGSSISTGSGLADFHLSRSTASATLAVTSARDCSAQVWINGVLKYTLNLTSGVKQTRSLSGADLQPGVNVITVYQYLSRGMYGANYLTVSLDGQKRAIPAAGSYTDGYSEPDADSQPPTTQGESTTTANSPTVTTNKPVTSAQQPSVTQSPTVTATTASGSGTTQRPAATGSTPTTSASGGSAATGSSPSVSTPSGSTAAGPSPTPSTSASGGSAVTGSSPSASTPGGSAATGSTPSASAPGGSAVTGSSPSASTPGGSAATESSPSASAPVGTASTDASSADSSAPMGSGTSDAPEITEPESIAPGDPSGATSDQGTSDSGAPSGSGSGPETAPAAGSTDTPQKTPTPSGGTASIDPVTPHDSEDSDGGWILPAVLIGIAVIAAGGAAVGIVFWKKRKNKD